LKSFFTETAEGLDCKMTKEVLAWQLEYKSFFFFSALAATAPAVRNVDGR
jgi:hypothetical protein